MDGVEEPGEEERVRLVFGVEETMTKVISLRSGEPYDELVGRPSPFGNPFSHMSDTTAEFRVVSRYEAVRRHAEWIKTQPELLAKVKRELTGLTLACHCGTNEINRGMCHAVTLSKICDRKFRSW